MKSLLFLALALFLLVKAASVALLAVYCFKGRKK